MVYNIGFNFESDIDHSYPKTHMASAYIMDTIQAQIHLLTAHEMLINGGEWAVHPLHVRLPPPPIANGTEKVHSTICPDLDQALPERSPSELFNRFFVTLGDNGNNTFSFDFKFNKLPFTPLLVHELQDSPILCEGYGRNTFVATDPSCASVYNSKTHSTAVFDATVSTRYHDVDSECMQVMERLKDLDLKDIHYVLVTPYEEQGEERRVEVVFPRNLAPGTQVKVWHLPMRKQSWLDRIDSECCIFIAFMLLMFMCSVDADYEVMG